MAERNSWAVSDTPNGVITTEDARLAINALMQSGPTPVTSRNGIRPGPGDPGRVFAAPAPTKKVTVQPFQMFMRPARGIGSYVQTLDAVKELDLLTGHPAHSQLARHDLIIAQQSDKFYGDNENGFVVRHVPGTASATPADPTVPGSADYVVLARVRIPAEATMITQDMIEDRRPGWVVGIGGVTPVRGSVEREAATTYDGLTAYRQDRQWLEIHDGSRWRVPSIPVCRSLADITTTITNPHLGQLVFSTEDRLIYLWDGSGWVGAVSTGGPSTATRHEARYEIREGQAQTFPFKTLTRIEFRTAVYTTPDVTVTDNRIFTFNRPGLWRISVSQRIRHPASGDLYACYVAIANNSPDFAPRYANSQVTYDPGNAASLSCSTENRFAAGAQLCAILWSSAPANREHWLAPTEMGVNNITLTWLRP